MEADELLLMYEAKLFAVYNGIGFITERIVSKLNLIRSSLNTGLADWTTVRSRWKLTLNRISE